MRSLFIYPGYLRVVVDADITVETNELVYSIVGLDTFKRSTKILFNAVLSNTILILVIIITKLKEKF